MIQVHQEKDRIRYEMEWSDYFKHPECWGSDALIDWPNPFTDFARPVFFTKLRALVKKQIYCSCFPKNVCDIGGGCGRFAYELTLLFKNLESIVLVEPDSDFVYIAKKMLGSLIYKQDDYFLRIKQEHKSESFISINQCTAEEFCPTVKYDVVCCLNVLDRHPNPALLVEKLEEFTNKQGVLVLSSPLDFQAEYTPHQNRVKDLEDLIDGEKWEVLGKYELPYEFRRKRAWVRFASQVLLVKKTI